MIGWPAGALDRIALIVDVLDPVLGGDLGDLRHGKAGTARFGEVAERKQV